MIIKQSLLAFSILLLSQTVVLAQFNFNNDNCGNSNILCSGSISPNKGLTTQNRNADAPPGSCITPGGRGVWFYIEGQRTGGSVSVNVSNIDSVNCGMEMQIFNDNGGCALAPLDTCVAGVDYASVSGGSGNSTMSCTFTVTAGVRYQILVSTPPGCTNGEQFFITANTNGVGIDALNDSSILGFPVAEMTSIILDPCDTSQIRLSNNTRDKGGTVSYFLDTLGIDDYFEWMVPVGGSDTVYFTPCNFFTPRLVTCNECVEDCDVGSAQNLPADYVSVPSAALLPEVDTVYSGCVGSPIGFEVAATMMGDVLGNPQPNIDRFILEVVQRCSGALDTTIFYIGRDTLPAGNPLPDTIVNSSTGHYREIMTDSIINPDLEFIDGRDTIYDFINAMGDIGYHYIPCGDTLWVKIKAEGFCNKSGGCPDSVQVVFKLQPGMIPVMEENVQFCLDDLDKYIPFRLDLITGAGQPPFTITWYDSVINPAFEITSAAGISATGKDTLDLNEIGQLWDPFAFYPQHYENEMDHRFIIKIKDDFGCSVLDTVEVKLHKPVIDSLHITNFNNATAACDVDHNMVPEIPSFCPGTLLLPSNPGYPMAPDPLHAFEFCPGDSIPLSLAIRGKSVLKVEWFDADPASGALVGPAVGVFSTLPALLPSGDRFHFPNSPINDSIFYFKDKTQIADFTLALVLTDFAGCADTAYVCIPIHEPPTIDVVDTLKVDDIPLVDSMFHVLGACSGSTFDWYAVDPNIPGWGFFKDSLLHIQLGDSSWAWFNYVDTLAIATNQLVDSTFMFAVIVQDGATGCVDTLIFDFNVGPFQRINAGIDRTICNGDSTIIGGDVTMPTAPAGTTITWAPNFRIDDTTIANPVVFPDTTTQYVLIVTDTSGSMKLDTVTVRVNPLPVANAGNTVDTICQGTSVSLMGDSANAQSISWQTAPATPVGGSFTSTITDTTTWTPPVGFGGNVRFYFNVVGGGICMPTLDSVDVFVQLNPIADVGAGPYGDICQEGSVNIFANGQNGTVTWSDGGVGGAFVPATGNTPVYTAPIGYAGPVTITSNVISPFAICGADSDDFSVTVFDSTTVHINLPTVDTTICETGEINILATAANQSSVSWTGSPGFTPPNSLTPTWNPIFGPGVYTLMITADNLNPCPAVQDSFDVTVIAVPNAGTGGPYTDLCVNSCLGLSGTGTDGVISWSDGGIGGTFNPPNSNNSQYCPPVGYSGPITVTQYVASAFVPCGIDSSSFTIQVFDSTTTAISINDTAICDGYTIQLASASANESAVAWTCSLGAIFSNPNGAQTDFTPTSGPGTYLVTLMASNTTPCPGVEDQITITVLENPQVSPTVNQLSACRGDTITLEANPNNGVDSLVYWDDANAGGQFIPTSQQADVQYVTPQQVGSFVLTVTGTSKHCGNSTGTIQINVGCVGLDEPGWRNVAFNLHPNPANAQIQIEFGQKTSPRASWHYYVKNLTGQTVIQSDLLRSDMDWLNTSQLSSGLYFIAVFESGRYVGARKFCIQH